MPLRWFLVATLLAAACGSSTPERVVLCASDADCSSGDLRRAGVCPRGVESSGPTNQTNSTMATTGPTPPSLNGGINANIKVTLKEASGVAATGRAFTIAFTGSNNSFSPSATTNGSGVATFYASTKKETKNLAANSGSVTLTGSVAFAFATSSASLTSHAPASFRRTHVLA